MRLHHRKCLHHTGYDGRNSVYSKNLEWMNKALPVYFVAGDEDPVGNYGKSVVRTAKAFADHGMKRIDLKLYPGCRHELHHELNRQEFFEDILHWIAQNV